MPVEPSEKISIIPVVRREDKIMLNEKKRPKRREQKQEKDKKKIDIRV